MMRELNILPFYAICKRVLLILIALLFVMPIIWSSIQRQYDKAYLKDFLKSIGTFPVNLTFTNLSYYTFDEKNHPISVKAPYGRAEDEKTQKLFLDKPKIKITNENGRPVEISAHKGEFNRLEKNISLTDNVRLTDIKQNTTATTNKIIFDANKGTLTVPNKLETISGDNKMTAGKAEVSQKDRKAHFSGGVHITINPEKN